jgi:hypothetical protein
MRLLPIFLSVPLVFFGCSRIDTPKKPHLIINGLNFDNLISLRGDYQLMYSHLAIRHDLNDQKFFGFSNIGCFIYKEPERRAYWLFRSREDAELGFFERGFSVVNSEDLFCETGYNRVSGFFFLEKDEKYKAQKGTIIVRGAIRATDNKGRESVEPD